MIGRLAIVALAVGLAGCAGLEPAGRNARSSGPAPAASAPPPQRTAALPPPQTSQPPQATTPAPQQAPQLTVPPAAQREQPAPVATTPPPQRTQPTAPPAAAPQVSVPAPAPAQETAAPSRPRSADEDIVVPGQVTTQVPPPAGDPRTNEERRADIRAWDQCVMQVQSAFDSDPMRPQLTTPEEYCSTSLGMSGRTAVPIGRRR
ncbi:MAG: hypothetical protein AB7G40_00670 [Hyphomonadaceae bacterium]